MPPDDQSKSEAEKILESHPRVIDLSTFRQILEMDEPNDSEFSHSIVYDFFDQADETLGEMDDAGEKEDLEKLSSLGHFLKGSSATLGLINVRDGCEHIQRLGKCEDSEGNRVLEADDCLSRIKKEVDTVKSEIKVARKRFDAYYDFIAE